MRCPRCRFRRSNDAAKTELSMNSEPQKPKNDTDDVLFIARHVIEAAKRAPPPKGFVEGDKFEVWQVVPEGGNKLLAADAA